MGVAVVVLVGALTAGVGASNAVRRTGHAALRAGAHGGGELHVEAPYGAWIVEYDVSPGISGLDLGGKGVTEAPLYGGVTTTTNWLPAKGFDADVPLDVDVRISPASSPAASMRAPAAKEAALAGTWLLITRDRRRVDDIDRHVRERLRAAAAER